MALTKKDLNQIQEIVQTAITENNKVIFQSIFSYMNQVFATKQDLKDLKLEFSHLPTKEEFYKSQDELVTELQALREEVEISNARSSENRERIERIEAKLSISY